MTPSFAADTLAGKAALVTGAAQGIGLAIARALVEAGASVLLADVDVAVEQAAASIGTRSAARIVDVRDEDALAAAADDVIARFGSLDIMVNNAALTIAKPVWDIPAAEWDDVMAVNLRGVFFGCRVAGRHMRAQSFGRIINLTSLAGQRGGAVAGAHYSASKAGIIALTKCFAQELAGDGVTVNAIAPAAIDGPMAQAMPREKVSAMAATIPVKRLGDDREVAAAAIYLASDAAGFVTGTTLDINGGLFMR